MVTAQQFNLKMYFTATVKIILCSNYTSSALLMFKWDPMRAKTGYNYTSYNKIAQSQFINVKYFNKKICINTDVGKKTVNKIVKWNGK